jgi:hypothetical protein
LWAYDIASKPSPLFGFGVNLKIAVQPSQRAEPSPPRLPKWGARRECATRTSNFVLGKMLL